MATRSAQVPTGYDAFSMFAPVMMVLPEASSWCNSSDAPTRKSEYGPGFSHISIRSSLVTLSCCIACYTLPQLAERWRHGGVATASLTVSFVPRIKASGAYGLQLCSTYTTDQPILFIDRFGGHRLDRGGHRGGKKGRRGSARGALLSYRGGPRPTVELIGLLRCWQPARPEYGWVSEHGWEIRERVRRVAGAVIVAIDRHGGMY